MIFELAYLSFIPSIVPRENLSKANSKLEASRSTAGIIGPSIFGYIISIFTAPFAIILESISFLISAIIIRSVKSTEQLDESLNNQNIFKLIKSGLIIIVKEPVFRTITACTAILNFCGSAISALYMLYIIKTLHITSLNLGTILGLGSLGAILGAIFASKFIAKFGFGITLLSSCILITLGSTIYFITQVSLRQSITPNNLLGRVNASSRFISRSMVPLGAILAGTLSSYLDLKVTILIFSIGFMFTIILLIISKITKIKDIPDTLVIVSTPT